MMMPPGAITTMERFGAQAFDPRGSRDRDYGDGISLVLLKK
jgi:hypothetical protein